VPYDVSASYSKFADHFIGTGTAIGDPYELASLGATFGKVRTSENPIYVGSVKTNLGHLEGCAGLAGLIKTVLVLENGKIPPLAGFEKPNPRLKLDEWHVALPTELVPWPESGLRRASVNSFGYGGANAHVVMDDAYHFLQQYHALENRQYEPASTHPSSSDDGSEFSLVPTPAEPLADRLDMVECVEEYKLFLFSSADQAGLKRLATIYADFLENDMACVDWPMFSANLAYTLSSRRTFLDHRSYVVADSAQNLLLQLGEGLPKRRRTAKANNTLFIFSGQGAQWATMGKELMKYRVYRKSLERSQDALTKLGCSWSIIDELFAPKDTSRVDAPEFSQPLCTALQLALVELFASWEVVPKAVVGHSSGEIAAAYAAGLISHEEANKVAYLRGIYSAEVTKRQTGVGGAMMAVGLSPEACEPYLQRIRPGSVVVACINSPASVTLSGDEDAIMELEGLITQDSAFARRLRVPTAYHSHHMQIVADDYLKSMGTMETATKTSNVIMFSSVTGAPIAASDVDAQYWVKNLLSTVRFSDAVRAVLTQPVNPKSRRKVFVQYAAVLECGPAEALKGPLNQILAATDEKLVASVPYVSMLSRNQNAAITAMKAAGRIWAQGISVDLLQVNFQDSTAKTCKNLVNLPPYPWNHGKRYFHESNWGRQYRHIEKPRTDLLGLRQENQNVEEPRWHNWIKLAEQPWLSDHRVQQQILYPGAAFVTMAFEASRELMDGTRTLKAFQVENIMFKRGLMVPSGDDVAETAIHLRPRSPCHVGAQSWDFNIFSKADAEAWAENCTGTVSVFYATEPDDAAADALEWEASRSLLGDISKRATRTIPPETFYKLFDRKMNLQYGPLHRNVTRCVAGVGEGLGSVTIPDTKAIMPSRFEYPHLIHPSTLDSVFHMQALGYLHSLSGDESLIPISIDSIYVAADVPTAPGSELVGYSKGTQSVSGDSVGDIVLSDEQWSSPKIVVRGFLSRDMSVASPETSGPDARSKKCTHIEWVELDPSTVLPDTEVTFTADEADVTLIGHMAVQSGITEVVIIHNANASAEVTSLAGILYNQLEHPKLRIVLRTYPQAWHESEDQNAVVEDASGRCVLSLVEAEDPLIAHWQDASSFETFRSVVLQAEALLWITRGGDAVSEKDLQFHVSTGLLRTVRVERPQLKLAHLDLNPSTSLASDKTASLIFNALKASVLAGTSAVEYELAETNGKLFVPRLRTQLSFHAELGRPSQHQATTEKQQLSALTAPSRASLSGSKRDGLNDVCWYSDPHHEISTALGLHEVEVQLSTIALDRVDASNNSISVMGAAGVVISTGADVQQVAIGDRVAVCGLDNELQTHVRAQEDHIRRIPDFMSLSAAAGLSSALCAAEAMILGPGCVEPGETVLICAFPGTLQLMLVSAALHAGARVLVTSETLANRRLLEYGLDIPESQILGPVQSEGTWKSLGRLTEAGTVDVAINMCGLALDKCVTSLGDFGRFYVWGAKAPTFTEGLAARNITLSAVDLIHMRKGAPRRLASLLARSWDRAKDGSLDYPLPGKKFTIGEYRAAVDYLNSPDKCAGGVLISLSPTDVISVLPPTMKQLTLDPGATYVLSGGLGGIGRSIAEMMFAAGARNISFVSRSGASAPEAQKLLESLQARGCNAQAYACDITSTAAVEHFVMQSHERGETIKGVVQCAMVLRDAMFDNMTFEQWTQSLAPKVQGSWNLHRYLPADMDFFVMLSSMAGIIGNPGQANYSAAGTYQDALSRHRRAHGRACTTIDLGIVSDVGYIAENLAEFERLAYLENLFISERDLHLILRAAMLGHTRDGEPVSAQVVTGVGKELLVGGSIGTAMQSDRKYRDMHEETTGAAADSGADASEDAQTKDALKAADTLGAAIKIVENVLATNLAKALTMEKDDIDMEKPIHAYGGKVSSSTLRDIANIIYS
jgi:acyl transferase domain-containing protein/NADPH:quinone reductase-like Zn-dependent oxidoreductase/NAD(P)-dependent dehydrogenase (short-subunit alcohol dehydrogenase family)